MRDICIYGCIYAAYMPYMQHICVIYAYMAAYMQHICGIYAYAYMAAYMPVPEGTTNISEAHNYKTAKIFKVRNCKTAKISLLTKQSVILKQLAINSIVY